MDGALDFEMPSPKRMRMEAHSPTVTSSTAIPADDMDDIYGTPPSSRSSPPRTAQTHAQAIEKMHSRAPENLPQLPGLGLLCNGLSRLKDGGKEAGQDAEALESALSSKSVEEVANAPALEQGATQQEGLARDEVVTLTHSLNATKNFPPAIFSAVKETSMGSAQPKVEVSDGSAPVQRDESILESKLIQATIEPQSLSKPPNIEIDPIMQIMKNGATPATEAESGISRSIATIVGTNDRGGTSSKAGESTEHPENTRKADIIGGDVAGAKPNEDAEFEMDSSPLVSSSSDVSSDTSSSDNDSDAEDYVMLDPVEAARRLMAEDGGSDDEKPGKGGKGISGIPRTMNEKPEEVVPKPNVTITPDMHVEELGQVENLIDNLALIKANTSGEYQVLESGSVLCLENRSVIGVVAETLGRVQQPYYSVRFTNAASMAEDGITQHTKIFYTTQFSNTVFTQRLRAYKGSDASNLHDEEIGDDELEFSDDEAEAEHKRHVKLQKQAKRDGRRGQGEGFSRGSQGTPGGASNGYNRGLPSLPEYTPTSTDPSLNYDDVQDGNDDELYTPLARPPNLHEMMLGDPPSGENPANRGSGHRGGRDRGGRDRGRGGRGRGNRGGDRGGRGDRRDQGSRGSGNRGGSRGRNQNALAHMDQSLPSIVQKSDHGVSPRPPQSNGITQHADQSEGVQSQQPPQQSPMAPPAYQVPFQAQSYSNYPTQYPSAYGQPFSQPQQYQDYPSPYLQQQYNHQYYQAQQLSPQGYQAHQTFGYPQYPAQQVPPSPSNAPPGAHINPNFFRQQAQPQAPPGNGNTSEQPGYTSNSDFAKYI